MRPILFTIGSYPVMSYSFFMFLGLFAGVITLFFMMKYSDRTIKDILIAFLVGAIGIPLGARVLNVFLNIEGYTIQEMISLNRNGFSLYGGLITGFVFIYFYGKYRGVNAYSLMDPMTPGLGLAIMFMRMGCLLNGCCYGHESSVPWAYPFLRAQLTSSKSIISMVSSSKSGLIYCHPTQAYEAIGGLVIALVCYSLLKKNAKDGLPTLAFITLFTGVRWINYYLRVFPKYMQNHPYFYPVLYLLIILMATYRMKKISPK